MKRTPENEPTHPRIFRSGVNGALQQTNFGGVAIEWKLVGEQYIPRPKEEIQIILEEQAKENQEPIGGVVGGIDGSVLDPDTMQYVPTEELKL